MYWFWSVCECPLFVVADPAHLYLSLVYVNTAVYSYGCHISNPQTATKSPATQMSTSNDSKSWYPATNSNFTRRKPLTDTKSTTLALIYSLICLLKLPSISTRCRQISNVQRCHQTLSCCHWNVPRLPHRAGGYGVVLSAPRQFICRTTILH